MSGYLINQRARYKAGAWLHVRHLPISLWVALLSQGQSCDCPNASEVTLTGVGKWTDIKSQQNTTKHIRMQNHCDVSVYIQGVVLPVYLFIISVLEFIV